MIKTRKTPLRKCIVTQEQLAKKELIRIVKNKEGIVQIDQSGRANGRGAYLKKDVEVVKLAKQRKALERSLQIEIPDQIYEDLIEMISNEQ